METESFLDGAKARPKTPAVVCDLDDTLCAQFDQPILAAVKAVVSGERAIQVHYVTARPEASRAGTERFLADHNLPGWKNLHFCPNHKSTRTHKADVIARLAKECHVLVSIGDHEEEEIASRAAGIPFLRVTCDNHEAVWSDFMRVLAAHAG